MTRTLAALLLLAGCAQPVHLQYDYGRSNMTAFRTQADLGRQSVANAQYPLSGEEGLALRQSVVKKTTEEKSGKAEQVDK